MMITRSKNRRKRGVEKEMEESVNHFQKKINGLTKELFDSGFEMIMVIAKEKASWSHQYGSEKGLKFFAKNPSLQSDFIHFCSYRSDNEIGTCTNDTVDETTDDQIGQKKLDETSNVETATEDEPDLNNTIEIGANNQDKTFNVITEKKDGPDLCNEKIMGKAILQLEELEADLQDEMCDHSNHETLQDKGAVADDALSNSDSNRECSMKLDDKSHCETLIDFLRAGLEKKKILKEKLTDNVVDTEKCTKEIEFINKVIKFYQDISTVVVDTGPDGYECDLCHLRLDKKNMGTHLIKHKNVLKEVLVSCENCDLQLPNSYMVKHNCTRRLPKHVEVTRRDLSYEIALIETKYRWLDFQTPINCDHCDAVLTNIRQCREHLMCRHLSEFHCKFCFNIYRDIYAIRSHLKEHTIGKVGLDNLKSCVTGDWRCTQCDRTFDRKTSLSRHIELIHTQVTSKLYICSLCHRKFRSEAMFKEHILSHRKKYSCNIDQCEAVFSNYKNFRKHRLLAHKEYVCKNVSKKMEFLCSFCGRVFSEQSKFKAHMEWKHDTGQPQTCDICGKVFKGKRALHNHKSSHRQSLKYQCELCGSSYKQRSGLFQHKKAYHSDGAEHPYIKSYRCEVCSKRFRYQRTLFHHLISQGHMTENQTVNKDAILECPFCDKKFYITDKLNRHLARSHKEHFAKKDATLECQFCDKKFYLEHKLKKHLARSHKEHSAKKDDILKCLLCDKKFYTKDKLNNHIARSHNPKKWRECEYCGKKFCHSGSLSHHRSKHKRPWPSCSFCKKQFLSMIELNMHIEENHTVCETSTKQYGGDNQPDNTVVLENTDCDQIHKVDEEPRMVMDLHFVDSENLESETCVTPISTENDIIEVHVQTEEMLVKPQHQLEVQGETREVLVIPEDQLEVQGQPKKILVKPQHQYVVQGKTKKILVKQQDQIEVEGETDEMFMNPQEQLIDQGKTQENLVKPEDQVPGQGHSQEMLMKQPDGLENQPCGRGIPDLITSNRHLELKHDKDQTKANNICGKVFKGKAALHDQKFSKRLKLKYQCDMCGISYRQRSGLFQHKKAYHSNGSIRPFIKLYRCEVCRISFRYQRTFFHHLVYEGHMTENQTVNKDDILECPLCDKKFYMKGKLQHHIAYGHRRKPLDCEYCGKTFRHRSGLSEHRKKHTGKRPFCHFCQKIFRNHDELNTHIEENHTTFDTTTKQNAAVKQPDHPLLIENSDCDQKHKVDKEPKVVMDLHFVNIENFESETCGAPISSEDQIVEVQIHNEEMLVNPSDEIKVQTQTEELLVKAPIQIEVQGKTEEIFIKPQHQLALKGETQEILVKPQNLIEVQGQEVQGQLEEIVMKPHDLLVLQGETPEISVTPQHQFIDQSQTREIFVKPQDHLVVQGQSQEVQLKPQNRFKNQPVTINTTTGSQLFSVLTGARYISCGDKTIQILGPSGTPLNSDSVIQIITEQSLSNE